MMFFSSLPAIMGGISVKIYKDRPFTSLIVDSRKAIASSGGLFFAVAGERHDGHSFIPFLYQLGLRQFIIEQEIDAAIFPEANIIRVHSSINALQDLAAFHRRQFSIPVVGITGSNGKTIVKEWLYQLMSQDFSIVKNPGSYNSQTGVPLSVWQMDYHHQLGIFEAGISQPGEMARLANIIQPTTVVFTNLGTAHDEGFKDTGAKIVEKLKFVLASDVVIYCKDHRLVAAGIEDGQIPAARLLSWGSGPGSKIKIERRSTTGYQVEWKEKKTVLTLPFTDTASVENACHCVAVMLSMNYSLEEIQERILKLRTIPMRLELKQGINGCQIIDDTYNNDLAGLQISLDFLTGIQNKKSVVILSDILQSGLREEILATKVADLLTVADVNRLIGVGSHMISQRKIFESALPCSFYMNTDDFLESEDFSRFQEEVILVKGARPFAFEKIVQRLVRKIHGTVMEIDLGAMVHNLNFFRSRLKEGVKLMAMVKAFAYGSGSEEVANLLQYHGIDYLGVAYPDEGVELRKNKIRLPIMVMNPSEESFETIYSNDLEPEIYSLRLLKSFSAFLRGRPYKIHLKIDTGMHRLGFEMEQIDEALGILKAHPEIVIASVFSHLAGADDALHDEFTKQQVDRFLVISELVKEKLGVTPALHILNSSGILRFPEYQFGMVRLGIGLYGIDPTDINENHLLPVTTLKTIISQIKTIRKGETIGYGRKGKAEKEMKLATLAIGYADGFSRFFSRGVGEVVIHGVRAPVIGNVCMDMTMVEVTNLSVKEGDEAIIFGKELPISELAKKINTIPYEILTGTSERVKRVYFAESI